MGLIFMNIAIYGKGGIGKSTIAANLSLIFSQMGKRVGLIGCDPKGDTCRLLSFKKLPTILDNYNLLKGDIENIKKLIYSKKNIACIEMGGPRPGVGCAGKGIIIGMEFLEKYRFFEDKDIIIYDVLGDVVCGGFASPVSKGFAQEIYIVTSEEHASLYAANNIITGMESIGGNIKGLIFNGKNLNNGHETIKLFSKKTNVPIAGKISYSEKFPELEFNKEAVIENYPEGEEAAEFKKLAENILNNDFNESARPLDDEAITNFFEKIRG